MHSIEELMAQYRDQATKLLDPHRSTIVDEIDAMDWLFSELARLISELEDCMDRPAREYRAKVAKRHLDALVLRANRAKLISLGQRVTKSN